MKILIVSLLFLLVILTGCTKYSVAPEIYGTCDEKTNSIHGMLSDKDTDVCFMVCEKSGGYSGKYTCKEGKIYCSCNE